METKTNVVMLKNVRLAFPHLFEPGRVDASGGYRRGALFIINNDDDENLGKVRDAIAAAAERKWPDAKKRAAILATLERQDKLALHDGITKAQYDGFGEDVSYVSANSKSSKDIDTVGKVTVIDADKTPLKESDGRPYAGCYVNALIEIYAQDNQFGQRVNAVLKGVQFVRDGDAFAGTPPASPDDFESLVSEAGAEDFV